MQDLPHSFGVQYIRRAGANVEESEKFLCPVCVFYVPDTAAKTKRGRCQCTARYLLSDSLLSIGLFVPRILAFVVKVEARNEKQSHKRISPYKYFPKQQHCARFSNRHKNKKRQDTQQIIHYQRPLEAHIEAIASSVFLNHILANVPLRQAFKKRKFLANAHCFLICFPIVSRETSD